MENNLEFKTFYNTNFKLIYYYLRKRLPQAQDAEDVCAESFAAIWENWNNVKPDSAKALLFAICKNKLNTYFRKQYGVQARFSLLTEQQEDSIAQLPDDELAESEKSKDIFTLLLNKLVAKLNENEQQLYKLKYKENQSYTQLAEILNISIENAKIRNNRLIKKLKQIWEQTQTQMI